MKTVLLTATLAFLLFVTGFVCGFLFRGAPPQIPAATPQARPTNRSAVFPAPTPGVVRASGARRGVSPSADNVRNARIQGEDAHPDRRGRAQAVRDLQAALSGGDRGAVHGALEDLMLPGEPLSTAEVGSLRALLSSGEVDGEAIEMLARALVRNGGVEGFDAVMSFASDPELSVEDRRRALEAVAEAPPELADRCLPAIGDFMESGIPRELQHTAAHALGRLMGDQSTGALLGLLDDRPAISPEVIFGAIAATGRAEDTDKLVAMLSTDIDRRSRVGLLRAIGEISGREGDGGVLLDLLQDAPDGLSRGVIADAIADSSHRMDMSTLRQALELAAGDEHAQASIAGALARHGGKAGVDTLIEASEDPVFRLDKRTLARALHEYEGRDAMPMMLDLMRQSHDIETIEPLAFRIARDGSAASMSELARMLESGNDEQRVAIAHALGAAPGNAPPLDRLVDTLRAETRPEVGSALAGSIGRLYGGEGLRRVTEVLDNTAATERREALLWGLQESWEHNPTEARELYVRLAGTDPAPEIRHQAIDIIQGRNDPALIPSLERILASEPDPEVRGRIQHAIRELETER